MDLEKEMERLGLGLKKNTSGTTAPLEPGMRYKIVQSSDPQTFVDKVNQELASGWVPMGGVSIAFFGSDTGFVLDTYKYAQALVKR